MAELRPRHRDISYEVENKLRETSTSCWDSGQRGDYRFKYDGIQEDVVTIEDKKYLSYSSE